MYAPYMCAHTRRARSCVLVCHLAVEAHATRPAHFGSGLRGPSRQQLHRRARRYDQRPGCHGRWPLGRLLCPRLLGHLVSEAHSADISMCVFVCVCTRVHACVLTPAQARAHTHTGTQAHTHTQQQNTCEHYVRACVFNSRQ